MLRICTVVGARPQFVKASAVSRLIAERAGRVEEVVVHTGQHYDYAMNEVFFRELSLPTPAYNLGVGSGPHGRQTGAMLEKIEEVLQRERPDVVMVYGDTNSTLAGALAAAKLTIPVAHVEAGMRNGNLKMPEEINRVLADRLTTFYFCSTQNAVRNLEREGIFHEPDRRWVMNVGDVMLDSVNYYYPAILDRTEVPARYGLKPKQYVLATVHRAESTDDAYVLSEIMNALSEVSAWKKVLLPLHPRTSAALQRHRIDPAGRGLTVIEPVGYLDMMALLLHASVVITDSGGVQKEAYFLRTPCVTARSETEWVETSQSGWNAIAGTDRERIVSLAKTMAETDHPPQQPFFGAGDAAEKIVRFFLGME